MTKPVTVAVSGGFDPIHPGHIELFKKARALGNKLIVILNNDNWLVKKKGYVFQPENDRVKILRALRDVDDVILTRHEFNDTDMSVSYELAKIRPDIFANGGDRTQTNVPEVGICGQYGIKMVFDVGGSKVASSTEIGERNEV